MSETARDGEHPRESPRLGRMWRALGRDDRLPIDPDLAPEDPGEPSVDHHPAVGRRQRDPREFLAIWLGGFLGTAARYGVVRCWPTPHGSFPAATFAVNITGALALGVLLALILERGSPTRYFRVFACVGFLGAWTTMSTFATEADVLVKGGDAALALGYVMTSLLAGLVAVAAGIALGRRRSVT